MAGSRRRSEMSQLVRIYTKTGDDGTDGPPGQPVGCPRTTSGSRSTGRRRAQRRARAGPGHGSRRRRRCAWSPSSRTSCSSSARRWPTRSPMGPFHRAITAEHVERLESGDRRAGERARAADPVHPAGGYARRRAAPPGADGLPPRRAAGRRAVAPARRGRPASR